jgi:hypothetical protein
MVSCGLGRSRKAWQRAANAGVWGRGLFWTAAALGQLADLAGIVFVYRVCAFLPAIGLLAALLPDTTRRSR